MKEKPLFGKSRMEAFSDGVFAIAITLLILDVVVHPPGTLLEQVIHAWPSYIAYIISFLTIGAAWIGHTALTERIEQPDSVFLRLNLLVLLVVAFLPFPTRLVSESLTIAGDERVAITIYGLTLLAIRILGYLMVIYSERQHLLDPKKESLELKNEMRKFIPVIVGYSVAILIGLALPRLAVVVYFGVVAYTVIPFRDLARLLSHRS